MTVPDLDDFQNTRDSTVLGDESVRIDHDLVKELRAARRPGSGVGVSYKDQIEAAKKAAQAQRAAEVEQLQATARAVLDKDLARAVSIAVIHNLKDARLDCGTAEVAGAAVDLLRADGVACRMSSNQVFIELEPRPPVTYRGMGLGGPKDTPRDRA